MNEDILTRARENMMWYAPSCLSADPIVDMYIAIKLTAERHYRCSALAKAYTTMNSEFARYKLRVIQNTHSNNWLKMHGYPMRRRYPK